MRQRDGALRDRLRALQQALERFYELEQAPDISLFARSSESDARETLLLRENEDGLEIALLLPELQDHELTPGPSDAWLQIAEGVSHFVYVAERARTGLPATLLELELQAEVDKFVLLALVTHPAPDPHSVHESLYENVRYLHPPDSELGGRYRMANDLAARFVARLVARRDVLSTLATLRRFYRAGQAEKIHLARAA
jgi:hypothetical protein